MVKYQSMLHKNMYVQPEVVNTLNPGTLYRFIQAHKSMTV
jgi:hypothetical protein